MPSTLKSLALAVAIIGVATAAAAQSPFEKPPARSVQGRSGNSLTPPTNASPRAVLVAFLREQGRDESTTDALVEGTRNAGRNGISHVQFSQRVAGLQVYGTYAKAAYGARGELMNLVENLQSIPPTLRGTSLTPEQAIAAAIAELYPNVRTTSAGFFHTPPSATKVAIPHGDGAMSTGYVVLTWAEQGNQLHETLVDGNGAVLNVDNRTSNDSYSVFTVNPGATPQALVNGPGGGTLGSPSPNGWLTGVDQGTTDIKGYNVRAYLDAVSNNSSDGPGTAVSGGNFNTIANLTETPSSATNRPVAVQNLFYLNNVIHDELFRYGFTTAAGNFSGNDPVLAEAQDGGGTDNANFSTPPDGSSPRMQMYLWTGVGTHQVVVGANTYPAELAAFGPTLSTTGISGQIRVGSPADGCTTVGNVSGAIALVNRGNCDFTVKVKNAQAGGAIAVIVVNNQGDGLLVMGGSAKGIRIPAVFIGQTAGGAVSGIAPVSGIVRKSATSPLQRDGDLDADIVFHEYCHGLTWRMIGGMSGPLAGAIGEGMSDVCAELLTVPTDPAGADAIGEYSASSSNGIRRQRYAGYNLITYGDITGTEVHDDGELYGAIGWRLYELFTAAGGVTPRERLLTYMVDGMNYTPSTPKFEDMRDGILSATGDGSDPVLSPGNDACLVWDAFAHYGVGVGATATVRRRATVTESFQKPAGCGP
jgi:extracellular elastinolytic metalloproteinase